MVYTILKDRPSNIWPYWKSQALGLLLFTNDRVQNNSRTKNFFREKCYLSRDRDSFLFYLYTAWLLLIESVISSTYISCWLLLTLEYVSLLICLDFLSGVYDNHKLNSVDCHIGNISKSCFPSSLNLPPDFWLLL